MRHKEQFIKYLTTEKKYSAYTIRSYSEDLNQFNSFISIYYPNTDISKITHGIIREWIVNLMNQNLTVRSINRKLSTLKSFYKFLQKIEIIKFNPATKIISPKASKPLPKFVQSSKMDILLDEVKFNNDFSGMRDKLIINVFYQTGIRLSELINLKNVDIDEGKRTIRVLGKRDKERLIPISPNLLNEINDFNNEKRNLNIDSEFLFTNSKGIKLYPRMIYRIVNKYLNYVTTLDKKSPHILRHTFATNMLNAGADLNAIKELLGHSNLSATEIYTHTSFKKLKSIYKQAHPRA